VSPAANEQRHTRIDVEEVKRSRPLADVVAASGVSLRRAGNGTFRGLCPFHDERTPSFWIDARDPRNEHYWCFGCSAHGDVIAYVMARESCGFVEACELLAGGHVPNPTAAASPKAETSTLRWERMDPSGPERAMVRLAVEIYERGLWQSARAQAYLRRRGVADDIARAQRLGYADGQSLIECLSEPSGTDASARPFLQVARDLGLLIPRPSEWGPGPPVRELLRDRIVIPELRAGEPIWFIGRSLDAATAPTGGRRPRPKYLSLRGERPVLGLERVVEQPSVYLVEGPFDWLAAVSWGLPAFAICGTHFPSDRLPALKSALAVYGVFDPDRAGRSAAERFAPQIGTRWRPIRLPNGLDLAELAMLGEQGRDTFRVLVGRARSTAWQATSVGESGASS
jgi:DNA primase